MTSQVQTESQNPSQPFDTVKQGKQEIETRYQASLGNHVYVFPRHKTSKTMTPDTSLEQLADTDVYDLYTQNPHTSTTNTNASSSGKKTSSEETDMDCQLDRGQKKAESVKSNTSEKEKAKVVSLGPLELISLYKKTLKSHREETSEDLKTYEGNRPDASSHKKYGSLIMKIVKSRHSKEKSLEDLYGITQKLTKGDIKDARKSKKNVSKESSGFPKELLDALKGEFDGQNIETICVTEPLNPTTMVRKSEDKKSYSTNNPQADMQTRLSSKENSDKKKSKSKTINLYTTYKVASTKKAPGTTIVSQPELLEAFRKAQKQDNKSDKAQQNVSKPVKTVEIVKATGEVREVKATTKPKHEEKTREATREKLQEKEKEIRMTLKKKVPMESTLPTERLSTSRNTNKTQAATLKKGNTVQVSTQKKAAERQKTDENIEKKQMTEDALAVAKILDMAKTMPPVIKLDGKVKTKPKWIHTEVQEFCGKENELARSSTFDSPITKRIMEPRKIGMNLTVVTQSVVTQYEARERRREETRKKMMEVRKF